MVQGGVPPMRPDQALQPISRSGTGPAPQNIVVIARQVIVFGPGGGLFVYNATRTVLEESIAGAATTDPVLGISVPAGTATYNSFGKVISLLSTQNKAFFQYADQGAVQGQLIAALSSSSGTDPVAGFFYNAGLYGLDGVGGNITTIGPVISFGEIPFTRAAQIFPVIGGGANRPYLRLDAPEQTATTHLQMIMAGESPDLSKSAQLLVGIVSGATVLTSAGSANVLEVQGNQVIGPGGAGSGQAGIIQSVAPGGGAVESWHAMTLQNAWVNTGGVTSPAEYRLEPDNSVWIDGDISSGTIVSGTQIANALPSAYFPAHQQVLPLSILTGAAAAQSLSPVIALSTAGVLTIFNVPAGTTRIQFNGKMKLDA